MMEFFKTIDCRENFVVVDRSVKDSHYAFLDVASNLRKLSITVDTRIKDLTTDGIENWYPAALRWTCKVVRKSPHGALRISLESPWLRKSTKSATVGRHWEASETS
ncbi:hypothetical protein B0H14DRAFT_2565000 [Mycena olivaceomarginata]|nr:hypothetical protein B0H14DRAFT_2565000 [Mycena olivaceomarginata]